LPSRRRSAAPIVDRRTFLATAAGGAAAAALGGTLDARTARAADSAAGQVTIDYMHFYRPQDPIGKAIAKLIRQFEARFPNIKVNPIQVAIPTINDYQQKGYLAITAGNAPDVWTSFGAAGPGNQGFLQPLNPFLQADNNSFNLDGTKYNLDHWTGVQPVFCQVGKTIYGILHETDTRALWWDKAAFQAAGLNPELPPKNWTEWLDYTKRLTQKDSSGKVTRLGYAATSEEGRHPYIYMGLAGGGRGLHNRQWMTFNGPVPQIHLNNPQNIKGLLFWKSLCDAQGGIQLIDSFTKAIPATVVMPLFSGQAAMMITGDWRIADAKQYAPNFKYGVSPFPRPDDGGQHYNQSGGLILTIPKGAKHPQEGWQFIKFLMTAKADTQWCKDAGYIIPNTDLVSAHDPFFSKWPWNIFQGEAAYAGTWPTDAYGYPVYDVYAAAEDILYGRRSAADALGQVDRDWTKKINDHFGL
jgi:multiple sugar transport system substrate-binding protein